MVILVTVGDDATNDVLAALDQPREVWQNKIDAEHVCLGKHQPTVKEHDLAVDFYRCAVTADFAEATEEGDGNRCGHQVRYPSSLSTVRARRSVPAGAGPSGRRQSPTGTPSTPMATLTAWENTHVSLFMNW